MERWLCRGITFSIIQYLQTAYLVESGRLKPWIRYRNRQATHFHADSKSMFCLCGLSDGDHEFAIFILYCTFNP